MKRKHENTKAGPLGAKQGPWPGTASREDMLAVIDNAPCCIVLFKWPRGQILYINRKTLEVTGYPVTELPTSRAVEKTLFHDPKERRQVRKVLNEDVLKGDVTVVYKNRVKDGAIRFIQADCTMLNGMVMMFMTDVTRREEAEAEVRESESRFRSFFEESAEAILLFDGDTIIDCNPAALTMLGFSNRKAIVGIELTALSPDKQPDGRSSLKKMKSLMILARKKKSHRFEWIFVRPDGSPFPAELIVTAIRLEGKTAFCISLRDISVWKKAEGGLVASKRDLERRVKERTRELSSLNRRLLREIETRKTFGRELEKSREQLRRLSEHLHQARETERTRIAREVHDELGQSLSALKIDLTCLGNGVPEDYASLREQTKTMEARINDAIHAVRAICSRLRPPMLDHFGLPAALQWYLQEFEKRTSITCGAEIDLDISLQDKGLALMIFRIVQEATTNILRHAEARNVMVTLKKKGPGLVLKVKDDGKGISEEEVSDPRSLGVIGIQERVRFWGGRLQFQGKPGRGTTMTIWMPVGRRKRNFSPKGFEIREADKS